MASETVVVAALELLRLGVAALASVNAGDEKEARKLLVMAANRVNQANLAWEGAKQEGDDVGD